MKRTLYTFLLIFVASIATFAQVSNTATTLSKGSISATINPVILVDNDNDLAFFFLGGYGIAPGLDVGAHLGINYYNDNYFGVDIEYMLQMGSPSVSVSGGIHSTGEIGFDATLNVTVPIERVFNLYGGIDVDIIPENDNNSLPAWVFLGMEFNLKKNISILFEADIEINDNAGTMLGGGLQFYF